MNDVTTLNTASATPREVALKAFEHLKQGFADGNFEPYLAMLTDDYTFTAPLGEFRGKNSGKDRAIAYYKQVNDFNARFDFHQPSRITADGNTIVVEYEDEGAINGMPYKNLICNSFDVRGEQICGWREYWGDVDPKIVEIMTGGKS